MQIAVQVMVILAYPSPPHPRPYAYVLFRDDYTVADAGWRRVPPEAGFDPGEEGLPGMHQRLAFGDPVVAEENGYLYVWVSNESENTEVWFDDLKVTHTGTFVAQATDYGAWGDVLREQRTDERKYRYGYQGQYSEKDEETGWNHFELREYDAVIGGGPKLIRLRNSRRPTSGWVTKGIMLSIRMVIETFGVTSSRFGLSVPTHLEHLTVQAAFLAGWSTGQNSLGQWGYKLGQWGYKFRIGIGANSRNANQAAFRRYVPRSFVPNSFANPSIQVKRSLFELGLTP